MNLIATRRFVIVAASLVGALVIGWDVAHGSLFLPSVAVVALLLGLAPQLVGMWADAFFGGILMVGYLVGNRGFAQLNAPGIPLLPGEAMLGIALALVAWRSARLRSLPFRRDVINWLVLMWIIIGAARIPFDFRQHGFVAVRDFAMIYYALFFFIAQVWATQTVERRWLQNCLALGFALCGPVFYVFDQRQEWFTSNLAIAGVPLIFVKSDVAGGFMAAAIPWFVYRYANNRRLGWLALAGLALACAIACNSRAAVVAFLVGVLWLIVLRSWRMLGGIAVLIVAGCLALGAHAIADRRPFTATPLYRLYESATSVADFGGTRRYLTANLADKPDNNQFRLVWWRAVIDETWTSSLWLGLGFGRDLAAEFLRIYYADANEEFSARSPHNFLLTVFGRMGLLGVSVVLALLGAMAFMTWQAGRRLPVAARTTGSLPLWLAAWAVLTSACFGVVLEGPMGAVVFWTLLGLANATAKGETAIAQEESTEETPSPSSVQVVHPVRC